MVFKKIKLKECCDIISGSTPSRPKKEYWNGNIPWVTPKEIGSLDSPFLSDTLEKITDLGYKSCSTKLIPKNSVLLSSRAPIGLLAINSIELCTNQGFKNLVPKENIYYLYLYYALKYFTPLLKSRGTGTTFKELSKKAVEEFEIIIPPQKTDQIKIASLLYSIEELVKDRKTVLNSLTQLLDSEFLEMFGDPLANSKKWPTKELGDVCNVTKLAGYEYTKFIKYKDEGEIVAVRGLNVKEGVIKLNDAKYIDKKISDLLPRSKLYKNDIVMTYIGVNIGDTAIIRENDKYHLAPNVAKITPKNFNQLNPNYLITSLAFNRKQFDKFITNTAKQALNMGKIRQLILAVPPIKDQKLFGSKAEHIEKMIIEMNASLKHLNNLFESTQQEAFQGKLSTSRIDLKLISLKDHRITSNQNRIKQETEAEKKVINQINGEISKYHHSLPSTKAKSNVDNTIRQLDTELKIKGSIPFWDEYVKHRILKKQLNSSFTFQELMSKLQSFPFDELPQYDRIKIFLFDCLKEKKPVVKQRFDEELGQIKFDLVI